jgi:hypothetical protein
MASSEGKPYGKKCQSPAAGSGTELERFPRADAYGQHQCRPAGGCYETMPSAGDSHSIFHSTQHLAFGSVLGYHDTPYGLLCLGDLFHR